MANDRLYDFSTFINRQIETQERIEAYLSQLDALITVAVMAESFYDFSKSTLCNYFSVAADLVNEVSKANQLSLSELLKVA